MSDTRDQTQISLRAPSDLIGSFDKIAMVLQRPRSWVILRAMRLYFEGEGKTVLLDAEALEAMHQGDGLDLDDVLRAADEIVEQALRRKAS